MAPPAPSYPGLSDAAITQLGLSTSSPAASQVDSGPSGLSLLNPRASHKYYKGDLTVELLMKTWQLNLNKVNI